jgi:transaldolase
VRLTLEEGLDGARQLFEELAAVGIDYDDVTRVLEDEGVQKFADSFDELLGGIRAKRGQLVSA